MITSMSANIQAQTQMKAVAGARASILLANRKRTSRLVALSSSSSDDWRAFRAALIMGEQREESEAGTSTSSRSNLLHKNEALMCVSNPELADQPLWAVPCVLEKGAVILAASALSDASQLLQQHQQEAVIFVTSHDANGTTGVMLNRPTSLVLSRTLIQDETGESKLKHLFAENVLYMGGASMQEHVQVIHSEGTS